MKLSEIKGEQALDVIAELIEPIAELAGDDKVAALFKGGKKLTDESNRAYTIRRIAAGVPYMIKTHKSAVIRVFAALNLMASEEYAEKMNLLTLPKDIISALNDRAFLDLFTSAEPTEENVSADSASAKPKG